MNAPSLASRALLAVALMAGFYLLALAVAAGLVFIPYAMWAYLDRINVKIAAFCLIGAFIILKAIVPRSDHFEPPGPRLLSARHPRLFEALDSLAGATGQPMPAEVYLVPDVNAWVAQRGGVMGFGSHRVMGLGLPLLQSLTVSQLEAVLAHEFGHFHGGDTKLGPWIYKTRAAIGRTLQELAGHSSALQAPFQLYGALFLRITHAVSRQQELTADALAARTVGARPLQEGLRATHGAALAFQSYWSAEVAPVLQSGFLPPLAEGFARFSSVPAVADAVARGIEEEIVSGKGDPYDTHPPLRERIAALERLPPGPAARHDALAITLLDDVADLERRLLASVADESRVRALKRVDWKEVGREVYLPRWRAMAGEHAGALAGWTAEALPERLKAIEALGLALAKRAKGELRAEDRKRLAEATVGAALAVSLDSAGWTLHAPPGAAVAFEREGARLEPFLLVRRLAAGELAAEAWREECRASGLVGLPLGPPVAATAG